MRLEERRKSALLELEAYAAADSSSHHGEAADLGDEDDGVTGYGGKRNTTRMAADGAMVEIARRFGSLVKEVEGVRMEIRRLEG